MMGHIMMHHRYASYIGIDTSKNGREPYGIGTNEMVQ